MSKINSDKPYIQKILDIIQANDPAVSSLHCESLNDEDVQLICTALVNNNHITSLNIRFSRIGVDGVKALATNQTLTSLDVVYNGGVGDQIRANCSRMQSISKALLVELDSDILTGYRQVNEDKLILWLYSIFQAARIVREASSQISLA